VDYGYPCTFITYVLYDQLMKKRQGTMVKPLISQLAIRIVEHMRDQTMPKGAHLVEQTLADQFNVSRSPVREALMILKREGNVVFHPHRGFFLALPAAKIPNLNIAVPVSPEEETYYRIAEDRIQGALHGHVSEAELMSRYGISRIKLMKILVRMSQEGWVERRPGHGWNFLPILDTVEALEQSYRFRMLIEPAALLEATYRVDPVVFARLRREQESLLTSPVKSRMPFRLFETGASFHEQIVSCSGNRFFLEAIQHINRLRRLIEYSVEIDESRLNAYREHLEIITMLERGKHATASALLRDHIDQARVKKTESRTRKS
jgi:DNA-binding GntR family transcriptional regulator